LIQRSYTVPELAAEIGVTRQTVYFKTRPALGVDGSGVIKFKDRQFFVIKAKGYPIYYECLMPVLDALRKKYLCDKCTTMLDTVIKNAS